MSNLEEGVANDWVEHPGGGWVVRNNKIVWEQRMRTYEACSHPDDWRREFFNPDTNKWHKEKYSPPRFFNAGVWETVVPKSVRAFFERTGQVPPSPQNMPLQNEGVGSKSDQPLAEVLFNGKCPPGTKDDGAKVKWEFLPFKQLEHVARVGMYGSKKYAPENWKHVENGKMRYWNAAMRHLTEWKEEGPNDKGSGLRHLAHAAANCILALWFEDKEMAEQNKESKSDG